MPFIFKILKSSGALAVGSTALYTASNLGAIVSNVRIYNSSGATANATLSYRTTSALSVGTGIKVAVVPVANSASATYNNELTLPSPYVLDITVDRSVDCVVCGVDRVP